MSLSLIMGLGFSDNPEDGQRLINPSHQPIIDPVRSRLGVSTPLFWAVLSVALIISSDWAKRWFVSGAPILTFFIFLGASKGYRILPVIPLWTIFTTLHLVYSVASTSWLLYWVFTASCYPAIALSCLFQFNRVAEFARGRLRSLIKQLHFVNDKIAFFDIPALEINTDVSGLMVIRGLSISLSTLTVVAHGIELGVKLTDDMEISIHTDVVIISLFRRIQVGNVYANLKGGESEMTFHKLEENTRDEAGSPIMMEETPLLKRASMSAEKERIKVVKMTEEMTDGGEMQDSSAKEGLGSMKRLSPDNDSALKQYQETMKWIHDTSPISQARKELTRRITEDNDLDEEDEKGMRAAICSHLHTKPSVPHPPTRSIKVTTIQNLTPPYIRRFLHRLPMLLRLLLNPIAYFHPVGISSITAAGSGKWIRSMIGEKVFEDYGDQDSEVRRLEKKVSAWLSQANFALELVDVTGLAQVPFLTEFPIIASLTFADVMAYRTVPSKIRLNQVIRLGGADATFKLPTFLLPHHEHLLPPRPTRQDKEQLAAQVDRADGKPKAVQAAKELDATERDVAHVKMSVHASLPACFDQELLDFVAALVKASKVVEMEKEPNAMDDEISGFRDFTRSLHSATKDGLKKALVAGVVNDSWIAKAVGKVTKRLETAQGDVGWAGKLPVPLDVYRGGDRWEKEEGSKLLA